MDLISLCCSNLKPVTPSAVWSPCARSLKWWTLAAAAVWPAPSSGIYKRALHEASHAGQRWPLNVTSLRKLNHTTYHARLMKLMLFLLGYRQVDTQMGLT